MTSPTAAEPPAGSGEFGLDLELAAEAVSDLEEVGRQLVALRRQASELSRSAVADQTAHDLVSKEAFALLAQKADGGPGSLGVALDAGIVHVQGLIDQMKSDIARQESLDEEARRRLA